MSSVPLPPAPGATVVYKYGTGDPVPPGAVYLCTKVQDLPPAVQIAQHEIGGPTWLVWHYFRVPLL